MCGDSSSHHLLATAQNPDAESAQGVILVALRHAHGLTHQHVYVQHTPYCQDNTHSGHNRAPAWQGIHHGLWISSSLLFCAVSHFFPPRFVVSQVLELRMKKPRGWTAAPGDYLFLKVCPHPHRREYPRGCIRRVASADAPIPPKGRNSIARKCPL